MEVVTASRKAFPTDVPPSSPRRHGQGQLKATPLPGKIHFSKEVDDFRSRSTWFHPCHYYYPLDSMPYPKLKFKIENEFKPYLES
jgi:hypothetical protein